jgi:hypothetical protein
MCLLWSTNWGFISQKTTFFIVTAVKTSNRTKNIPVQQIVRYHYTSNNVSALQTDRLWCCHCYWHAHDWHHVHTEFHDDHFRHFIYLCGWNGTKSTVNASYCTNPGWYTVMTVEQWRNWMSGRGNRMTQRKPAPVRLCPPQIPHDLSRDRTRAAAVGSRTLIPWARTRPGCSASITFYLYIASNGSMIHEWWIGKYLSGSGDHVIEMTFCNLHGCFSKTTKHFRKRNWCRDLYSNRVFFNTSTNRCLCNNNCGYS